MPRYLLVGAVCALLANFILISFDYVGIHYIISSAVAFAMTVLLAYALHTRWTFGAERSFVGLLRYGAAMSLNFPLSVLLLFVLISLAGLKMAIAAPVATVLQTAFNYLATTALMRPRLHG